MLSVIDPDVATSHGRSMDRAREAMVFEMEKIRIPTLHLHGLQDQHLPNSRRQLAASYDPAAVTLLEIDYHHAMPWLKEDTLQLANLIRKMCRDTAVRS
jgi:hypothetical protein